MATVPFGGRCFDALRPVKPANFNAFQKRKRQTKRYVAAPEPASVPEPEPVKKRHYSLMKLEDYPPYAALGSQLVLYGPAPRRVVLCGCGRYWLDDKCLCASSNLESFQWAKQDPELYKNRQKEEKRWDNIGNLWYTQKKFIDDKWHSMSYSIVSKFHMLQDEESPIDCHSCETSGYSYCKCCCDNCDSKWCEGRCMDDDDYGYGCYGEYDSEDDCYCKYKGCDAKCGTLSCGCIDVCRGYCGRDDYCGF